MKYLKRKLVLLLLILCIINLPVLAKSKIKLIGNVKDGFSAKYINLPDSISFKVAEAQTIPNFISIPEDSLITLKVIRVQRERRWHKSGFILCKLLSYTPEEQEVAIDVSDKNIYLTVRKYEAVDKKEATLVATELIIMQGASFFAPCSDLGYYFIKGAILRERDPNWFKAGVYTAYENSVCWFYLKGKPIELTYGEQVDINDVPNKKVEKLISKIDKRKIKQIKKSERKISKIEQKRLKKDIKIAQKDNSYNIVVSAIDDAIENSDIISDKSIVSKADNKIKHFNKKYVKNEQKADKHIKKVVTKYEKRQFKIAKKSIIYKVVEDSIYENTQDIIDKYTDTML